MEDFNVSCSVRRLPNISQKMRVVRTCGLADAISHGNTIRGTEIFMDLKMKYGDDLTAEIFCEHYHHSQPMELEFFTEEDASSIADIIRDVLQFFMANGLSDGSRLSVTYRRKRVNAVIRIFPDYLNTDENIYRLIFPNKKGLYPWDEGCSFPDVIQMYPTAFICRIKDNPDSEPEK